MHHYSRKSIIMKYTRNGNAMSRLLKRLLVAVVLLASFSGRLAAQNDPAYVIYTGSNYLAHHWDEGTHTWVLQGVHNFSPECVWYSPNTNNYYFVDENDGNAKRYLYATHESGVALTTMKVNEVYTALGEPDLGTPPNMETWFTSYLSEITGNLYFYNWDHGLAHGHQTDPAGCLPHRQSDDGSQCWICYWVIYDGATWRMSTDDSYNPVSHSAEFRRIRIKAHEAVISESLGGAPNLENFSLNHTYNNSRLINFPVNNYSYYEIPAYTTYSISDVTCGAGSWTDRICDTTWTIHNYYNGADQGSNIPDVQGTYGLTVTSRAWSFEGDGAPYLSFASGSDQPTSTANNPTVYYRTANTSGDKTATLRVVVTYSNGATQERTATITVISECGNPLQAAAPVVNYEDVTVSWINTHADNYMVYWSADGISWNNSGELSNATFSYDITGLQYSSTYYYYVLAKCSGSWATAPASTSPLYYSFTTKAEPNLLVYGAIFGGGRMADVDGKTEVVIINCDSVSAVYGGNDIAGAVNGNAGSSIILGVNSGDAYDSYGTTTATVNVGSVYGGGNGYYAYNGTSFVAASDSKTSETVAAAASVMAMNPDYSVGSAVWTNGASSKTLEFPTIKKTAITVVNDYVLADSLFGGAKNAFVSNASDDNTLITVNGGTVYSVFGGNNCGGTLGSGTQHIVVNNTKTDLTAVALENSYTTGFGRDFGIRYLFGGGNLVKGTNVLVDILGGQTDTLFGGGNRADVDVVNINVNCAVSTTQTDYTLWGKTISKAIYNYTGTDYTIDYNYTWDGTGVYNVRTLFGGNNAMTMDKVPTITLTAGHVGTVYGGGNAGDMRYPYLAADVASPTTTTIDGNTVTYSTHVVMNSPNILVDYLYGGCQKSNVLYSTWVEIKNGRVGTVYGGCNISGDVGSKRVNTGLASGQAGYENVQGATWVVATGGFVYKDLFGGSNGFYHCSDDAWHALYKAGVNYDDPEELYIGIPIPTHNETHVYITKDAGTYATVYGDVYAGGNLANVGFQNQYPNYTNTLPGGDPRKLYPILSGQAYLNMDGGIVNGNVYGGGNMASVFGINHILVSGGTIFGALYGGNDRTGTVASMTNLNLDGQLASDGNTKLNGIKTYVKVTGNPYIGTVYGGGNGDYDYTSNSDVPYCGIPVKPIQNSTLVDINITGGDTTGIYHHDDIAYAGAGFIGTVFGGGDGVTVEGSPALTGSAITVLYNATTTHPTINNVGVIYGGNNKAVLTAVPEIILLNGRVGTVYGGCNQGDMIGTRRVTWRGAEFDDAGSFVRLRRKYKAVGAAGDSVVVNAVVSDAVYGGCRLSNVQNNSFVLVEGGDHSDVRIFGGNDIGGTVQGTSRVLMLDGTVKEIYGAGNGDYVYHANGTIFDKAGHQVAVGDMGRPISVDAKVDLTGGHCLSNVYAGGLAGDCGDSRLLVEGDAKIDGSLFGGGRGDVDNIGICESQAPHLGNVRADVSPSSTGTASVELKSMNAASKATHVYGGGHNGDCYNTNVTLFDGFNYRFNAIYGGCFASNIEGTSTVTLNGNNDGTHLTADTVYGGNNYSGKVQNTVLTINDGRYLHVFGAGNGDYYYNKNLAQRGFGTYTDGANESLYPGLGTFTPNPGLCFDTVPYSMDVEVNFNGGYYVSTVYGGGNMGLVGDREMLESQMTSSTAATRNEHIGHITVNIHAPAEFGRHVFAGARGVPKMSKRFFGLKDFNAGAGTGRNIDDSGDIGAQLVYAEKIVNMDGGIIHFSLYGGSEAVDDGFPYECIGKSSIDYYGGNRLTTAARGDHNSTLRPAAILNVIGGEVRKSVYGGGYQGNIFGSLYVNIGEDAINDSPVWTKDYGGTSFAAFKPSITSGATPGLLTKSVDQPVSLEASVYNGSDWGEADDKAYFNTRGVYGGETNILIDGHGYSTYHEDSPGLPGMNIAYSVIGAGTSTEGGDVNRLITIRNYGNYYECGSNSKGLFSIQRADKVILDHVYINLSGEQDAFSAYASPNYAFARIDTLIFYDDNVISVEAPSIYIANLVSMQDGGDVRTIDDPDAHLYTVVEQNGHLNDFEHPRLSDDMLDNLVGECTDAATEEQRLSACSTVDFCSKLPYTRGTSGKPMAINTLVMRNGSYMRISPFVDEFQNEHPSVHTPDGKDDPGDHYGHVKGWMYLVSQDETQSYVYAADKHYNDLNGSDGGFVSLCWCENINYDGTATKELIYHRVPAQGYRTWRVGTLQGSRTRHITLVANVDPDNVLNFNLPSGPYNVTNSDNQNTTSGTLTLAADHNFAFATATMELPPADGGNFYVINEVNIDQDNGNQMQLTDQGYDAALDGIFQFPDGARALDLTSISDPDDPDLRNYRFGLTFSTKHSESNFDPACWVGTTGAIDHVTLPSERQFYQMVDHDGDPLTPEVRQDFSCWPTSIISAVGTGWSQTGGFISLPVDEGHGVVPTLQFTLTYDKRLTTTITRDVVFTMDEYTSDGTYVGPVYVTVTISTVIKNFSDLEAPVLAMYNEGITNEYVRKVTIPASFLQRDLYLRGIEWHNAIPDADFTSSTTPVANMGSGDDVNNYFFLQDTNTEIGKTTISDASRVDNGSTYAGNNLFSLIISPTESTSENLNNHLGWYNIETTNIDVYGTAVDDYRNTNSIAGSWEFGDGSVGNADDVRTYNYRRRYDSHNYTDVANPYSATGCTHPGAVPVYGESGHETETISEFEARMNTYNADMAAYKACLQATQWYAYDSWRYGVENPYTKPVMGETGHETETESEYNTRLAASLWYAWERSGTEKQQTGLNNEGILLGTLDGRSTAGIDVTLRFNGDYVYHDYYQQELATVTLHLYWKNNKHVLTEAERLAGKTDEGFIDLVVHVRTRESGDTIYVAPNPTLTRTPEGFANPVTVASWRSQNSGAILDGSISQKMEIKNHPDAYMTNMKDAMLIFDEGDVISIMEPVPVTDGVNATTIHGQDYSIIQIIRYSGNHYTFPSLGCANRGAMFDVKSSGRLNLRNVWLNGSGCTRVKEADPNHHNYEYTNTERTSWTTSTTVAARGEGTPTYPSAVYYREDGLRVNALLYANAPMIYCHENGWVNMSSNVRMSNNINGSSDSLWNTTANNWVANDTNIRNPQVHVNPSDPNSDMLPQTHIPGGALAIVKDKTSGTQPTIVIGHNGIVYDCAVLDWNATAQNIDSREVAAGHSAIYRDASNNPRYPVLPLNYGAAVYVDGGKLQLGTSVASSDINVTMARNFYLLDNSSSNAGVAEKTKHELGGKETSFQVYWLDTINHQAYYALNNVYLTRTTSHDPEFKPDPVRRDVQSDKITFVTNLTPESRIGVSKWFPGYRYRGNPNMPYTSVSQHRFYNIIPRDTIGIAVDGSGKQRIATLNYENGVFFNDSSYFTATGSVAEGTAHFVTDNNYTLYKGNETANPSYRDKVYVFHHTNINTRNIYLQRCASFAKGVEQVPMQYTDATGHIVNYNDYKYGDSIFFRWNPDATCIASTDTIVFKVGGGFFPYTYRWYQDSLIDEVPAQHKVKLHREQVRERVTDGTNAIASILNSEGQESQYNARMRFRARRDTLVLRSLQHQQSQVKSTYFYYVTATDKTGHCEVSSPVMVRVAKQVVSPNVTDFASKFYVDTLNFLRHRNPYAYSAGYKDDLSNHNGFYEEMAAYNGTTPSASASGSGTQADIDANWTSYAQGSGTEPGTYADRGFKANIYKADYLYYRVPVPGVDSSSFHDHSDLITLNVGGNDYRVFRNWAGDTLYPYIRKVNGNQANDTLGYIIVKQRGEGFHIYKRTKESGDQTGVVYKYNNVIPLDVMETNVASNGWNPYTLLEKTGGYETTNWVPSDPATDDLAPDVTADFFPKRLVPFHTHTSNPGELDNGGIRRAGYSHNDMHWFNHGYNRGTLEQRITAHAFQGRPYHDENVAILHMEYYDDAEGNVQNAELTAEFGDLYASEMVPRYLRLYQAFTVSPVLEPAQARVDPYNNNQFPNGYFRAYPNYVTDYDAAWTAKDTLALYTAKNFTYDEFCAGSIIHLQPMPTSSTWQFVAWDYDVSAEEINSFVVSNNPEMNHPVAYYAPGEYWWQHVTTFPGNDHYQRDYNGDVHIKTYKGLAWLISTVNGYNGQNAHTFRFNKVYFDFTGDSVNMSTWRWTPLGNLNNPFEGEIVGNGKRIGGITCNENMVPRVGMFGYTNHATLKDFKIDYMLVKGNSYVGGIVAHADTATVIENIEITSATVIGEQVTGGFVGKANETTINNVKTTTEGEHQIDLKGNAIYAGGIVGEMTNTTGSNNSVKVTDLSLSSIYFGTLFGKSVSSNIGSKSATQSSFNNNYGQLVSYGGNRRIGGLAGYAENVELQNNYIYGNPKATDYVGGLVGYVGSNVNISNCYYVSGMTNSAWGYNTHPNSIQKSTTFRGRGKNVVLTERVDGYSNMTRALNRWVRAHGDSIYFTWRSAVDNENSGYPVFGEPDIITVHDSTHVKVCDNLEWDGLYFDQSGRYVFHVVDSADYLDSTFTLVLTVSHGDSTAVFDSVTLGEGYSGYGINLTAEQVQQLFGDDNSRDVVAIRYVDSLLTAQGCDSLVVLTLYVVNNNVGVPQVTDELRDVRVYPNPTLGVVNVEGSGLMSIEVYDNISRRVLQRKVDGNKTQFDLSNYPTGTYYVRVKTSTGAVVKKVIKK